MVSLTSKNKKAHLTPPNQGLPFIVVVLLSLVVTTSGLANQTAPLPVDAKAAIARAMNIDLSAAYHIHKTSDGYTTQNQAHNLKINFSDQEVRFSKSDSAASWALSLTGIGYETLKPPPPAKIKASTNRIELHRGSNLTEWHLNTPFGLEQGFTLSKPPENKHAGSPLRLELNVQSSFRPVLRNDHTVILQNCSGNTVARYAGLYLIDANNRSLPARLEINKNKIIIETDDTKARYPIYFWRQFRWNGFECTIHHH